MQTVYDFHQSTHKHLVQSQASIDSYIQKKHSIISQLDFTNGYAKAFALMLLDDCERLNLIASAIRIHEILKNNNIEMNSRQQAALLPLYPKVNRNSEFIGRFDAVCQKLQYAIDMEEDDDKLSIAAFLNYLAIVALNTPTSCAEQIWEKLTLAVNSQQYPFLRNAYIVLLLGIDLQNGQEVHSYIQKSIDRLLEKQDEPTVLLPKNQQTFWLRHEFKTIRLKSRHPLPLNTWTDIRVVYDFQTLSLYINGKLQEKCKVKPCFVRGNSMICLGSAHGNGDEISSRAPGRDSFKGDIASFRYFGWPRK